jgi:hypothetical protein
VSLEEGLGSTYRWIEAQLREQARAAAVEPRSERQAVATSL